MVYSEFPNWLINGILLGLLTAVVIAVIFYIGLRYFGIRDSRGGPYDQDALKRAEVRAYLEAIGEEAIEHATIDGVHVDFWLPDRAVAITFDASTYFALKENALTAVLLEHELPGHHIGSRLPFDTPPIRQAGSEHDEQAWARGILGVADSADTATIETAYRERIKDVHPDVGGDQRSLIEVIEAYEILTEE